MSFSKNGTTFPPKVPGFEKCGNIFGSRLPPSYTTNP